MSIFGNKNKKANDKDNAKIKLVEVSLLHFDRDFKNVFQQILKDKRIAKLELGELNLSEEDAARISQRFEIA